MKLSADRCFTESPTVAEQSAALESWYESKPAVRRLWGIKDAQTLRVVLLLEPTPDNDDVSPVWLANASAWSSELQLHARSPVQLEIVSGTSLDGIRTDSGPVVVANLFWRDVTLGED
jgi:hypothetical protein